MKNLQLSDPLSEREAKNRKTVTRRLARYTRRGFGSARYKPGDAVYFGEALTRVLVNGRPCAAYRRDGTLVSVSGQRVPWRWKRRVLPARFCPAFCARRFGLVLTVRPEKLKHMTKREERLEGFPLADGTKFRAYWERLHGGAPDPKLWVWRIEWRSIAGTVAWALDEAA